jgi:hypothetical protein
MANLFGEIIALFQYLNDKGQQIKLKIVNNMSKVKVPFPLNYPQKSPLKSRAKKGGAAGNIF